MRKLKYSFMGLAALVSFGNAGMLDSAYAVSLSPTQIPVAQKTQQSPLLKVTHRSPYGGYDSYGNSCVAWREKCRKTWQNDSHSYYNCLVYRGCAGSTGYSRPTAPRRVYHRAPQQRYYEPSLKDTAPYAGQYNNGGYNGNGYNGGYGYNTPYNGYNGNGYNGNGYNEPIYPKVPAHSEDNNCRDRHSECVMNWGTSYKNYFGCMRYYQCRPRFYPKIFRDSNEGEPEQDYEDYDQNGYNGEYRKPRYW